MFSNNVPISHNCLASTGHSEPGVDTGEHMGTGATQNGGYSLAEHDFK